MEEPPENESSNKDHASRIRKVRTSIQAESHRTRRKVLGALERLNQQLKRVDSE